MADIDEVAAKLASARRLAIAAACLLGLMALVLAIDLGIKRAIVDKAAEFRRLVEVSADGGASFGGGAGSGAAGVRGGSGGEHVGDDAGVAAAAGGRSGKGGVAGRVPPPSTSVG